MNQSSVINLKSLGVSWDVIPDEYGQSIVESKAKSKSFSPINSKQQVGD